MTETITKLHVVGDYRDVAANDVHTEYAKCTEEVMTDTAHMAGFALVVWDDEGNMSSAVYFGKRNPFAPIMIPDFARTLLTRDVVNG